MLIKTAGCRNDHEHLKKRRKLSYLAAFCFSVAAIVTFGSAARADFDAKFESFLRSYPLSGYADVQLGYGQLLWGSNSSSVMYGYVRPFAEVDTAGTYNSGLVGLDYYPISFVGFRGGKEWIQNDDKYRDFRCDLYECEGTRTRTFFQATLLAGYSIWFASFMIRWENWVQKHPEFGDAIDATTGLAAQALGDTQILVRGWTGFQINETWSIVGGLQYAQMTRHYGFSRLWLLGPAWKRDSVTIVAGGSLFQSSESDGGWGAYVGLTWEPFRSLALH